MRLRPVLGGEISEDVLENLPEILRPSKLGRVAGAVLERVSDEDPMRSNVVDTSWLQPNLKLVRLDVESNLASAPQHLGE
jgi:hypothetical protein